MASNGQRRKRRRRCSSALEKLRREVQDEERLYRIRLAEWTLSQQQRQQQQDDDQEAKDGNRQFVDQDKDDHEEEPTVLPNRELSFLPSPLPPEAGAVLPDLSLSLWSPQLTLHSVQFEEEASLETACRRRRRRRYCHLRGTCQLSLSENFPRGWDVTLCGEENRILTARLESADHEDNEEVEDDDEATRVWNDLRTTNTTNTAAWFFHQWRAYLSFCQFRDLALRPGGGSFPPNNDRKKKKKKKNEVRVSLNRQGLLQLVSSGKNREDEALLLQWQWTWNAVEGHDRLTLPPQDREEEGEETTLLLSANDSLIHLCQGRGDLLLSLLWKVYSSSTPSSHSTSKRSNAKKPLKITKKKKPGSLKRKRQEQDEQDEC